MKPIRLLELFGGIGACSSAFERLQLPYQIVDYVEIDKFAVKSYNEIHNTDFAPQDITKWDKDVAADFIMHGSPCFTKDTLILTDRGYLPIYDIQEEMQVLDFKNQYSRVEKFLSQGKKEIWNLYCMGTHGIRTTKNHRFFVRKKEKKWNHSKRKYDISYGQPMWVECKDLTKNHCIGYAINQEKTIPEWKGSTYTRGKKTYAVCSLDMTSPVLWYLAGRYVADGWIFRRKERKNHIAGTIICCGKHKIVPFIKTIGDSFSFTKAEERTTIKFRFINKELGEFFSQFGEGADNKKIPGFVFNLPCSLLENFLKGYWDADGSYCNGVFKATTISKELAYGLGQCIAKVYQTPFRIYKTEVKQSKDIEGRIVHQKNTYQIVYKKQICRQDHAFYENEMIWFPVRKVENTHVYDDVYDITVQNTHSFTANGMIAHNCQDFSIAGNQAGGDKNSGTRSSLLYETLRIVQKLHPNYVLWENVRNMLSDRHRHNFDAYWDYMESQGYINYSWNLNSKDFQVPQNRLRVFTLSIKKEVHNRELMVPLGEKLIRCLADILEENVEEKYYLSDQALQGLLRHKEKHAAKGNGFGCQIVDLLEPSNPILVGGQGLEKNLIPSLSPTLSARYYKDGSECLINEPKVQQIGNLFQYKRENPSAGRVYDQCGLSPTLTNMQGGHRQPYIVEANHILSLKNLKDIIVPSTISERNAVPVKSEGHECDSERSLMTPVKAGTYASMASSCEFAQIKNKKEKIKNNGSSRCIYDPLLGIVKSESTSQYYGVDEPVAPNGAGKFRCDLHHSSAVVAMGTVVLAELKDERPWCDFENAKHCGCLMGCRPFIAAMRGRYIENEKPVIGRSVGRNPENPSRRVAGDPTEQRLEINARGLCNTLTSVQKDNLVIEPRSRFDSVRCLNSKGGRTGIEGLQPSLQNRIYDSRGISTYLTNMNTYPWYLIPYDIHYRIRKLTPKECWRLMGFTDEEFEKAASVNSNTQLYKQAGNSIVVPVLMAILKEVFLHED